MSEVNVGTRNPERVEYYFNTRDGCVIALGSIALLESTDYFPYLEILIDHHRLIVGSEATEAYQNLQLPILTVGESLRGPFPDMESGNYEHAIDWSRASRSLYKNCGEFYVEVLPLPDAIKAMQLNRNIISRGNRAVTLGPSEKQIVNPTRFGSLSNFYQEIGAQRTNRRFPGVGAAEALAYVHEKEKELGHIPSEDELYEISANDPSAPSYEVLRRRVKNVLSVAAEESGLIPRSVALDSDFIDRWGVEYFAVNGLEPMDHYMEFYSMIGVGPNGNIARKNHGSMSEYRTIVRKLYSAENLKIQAAARQNHDLREILRTSQSEHQAIGLYVRYMVVKKVFPELNADELEKITNSDTDDGFVSELTKLDVSIDNAAISQEAEKFGVFRNFWRIQYIESLAIENVVRRYIERTSGRLDVKEEALAERAVKTAVDYCRIANVSRFKDLTIERLQNKDLLPSEPTFSLLFYSKDIFRMLVKRQAAMEQQAIKQIDMSRFRQEAIDELEDAIATEAVDRRLFSGIRNGTDLLVRYYRYKAVTSILPEASTWVISRIVKANGTVTDLISAIKNADPWVKESDIRSGLNEYLVARDLWRIDPAYLTELRQSISKWGRSRANKTT